MALTEPENVGSDATVTPETSIAVTAGVIEAGDSGAHGDETATLDPFADVVIVGTKHGYRCSGILVDDTHVLTAAHCLPAERVGVGNGLPDVVEVAVRRAERHPDADVALITLDASVRVKPRARRTRRDATPPLGVLRIVGFGLKDQLRLAGFGQKRQLDVPVDGWGCDRRRGRELGCNAAFEMLLRGGRNNDTCFGDSGGGVFELGEHGWRLLGIVSRGTRPKRVLCGEGGIYTRVDVIDAWITRTTKR